MTDADNDSEDEKTVIFSNMKQLLSKTEEEAKEKNACLLALGGELNGSLFDLEAGKNVIGRSVSTTHRFDFEGISRQHFVIEIEDQTWNATITDLASSNGTYLNNKKLSATVGLQKGDVIKLGEIALQFIPKGDPERLTYDKLVKEVNIDGLTQCFNKTYFNEVTENAVVKARTLKTPLSLIAFDIDHFKQINDQYGHHGGDIVLKKLAYLVQIEGVREGDVFARYGGEEFVILLPQTDLRLAVKIAERLRKLIKEHFFFYDNNNIPVSVSVGVAEVRDDVNSGTDLFKLADQGVYISKKAGRNQVNSLQT